jgi:hypothetical protein
MVSFSASLSFVLTLFSGTFVDSKRLLSFVLLKFDPGGGGTSGLFWWTPRRWRLDALPMAFMGCWMAAADGEWTGTNVLQFSPPIVLKIIKLLSIAAKVKP